MSHIHIPDGVLPIGWWLAGYLLAGLIVLLAVRHVEKEDVRKKIPFLGVISALMLITMSVPLGALPFHINLTVLSGVIAGPWLGFIAVFIVNLLLAFVGHGGITVVGVNTLILGVEIFAGWGIFRLLRKRAHDLPAIGIATVLALLMSTSLMAGIVGFSQVGWEYALPHHHEHGEHPAGHAPDEGLAANLELSGISGEEQGLTDALHTAEEPSAGHDEKTESIREMIAEISFLHISGLVAIGVILLLGIGLEVLVTILMVRFFKLVRPDLIGA